MIFTFIAFIFDPFCIFTVLFTRMRMRMRDMVLTINAFTCLSTCYSCIKTLTVFFLALRFFTNASRTIFAWTLTFYLCFCLFYELLVFMIIKAAIATTLWCTLFSHWETFTIIFKTVSFSTSASCLFSFDIWCVDHWLFFSDKLNSQRVFLLWYLLMLMLLETSNWMIGHIFNCLDQLQSVINHVEGG